MAKVVAAGRLDGPGCAAYFAELFQDQVIAAVVRGWDPSETVAVCEQLWDAGIQITEVPIETESAETSLAAAVKAGHQRGRIVGAGTVTTPRRSQAAAAVGAAFTVAPGFNDLVARACQEAGIAHLPGVATPTEIQQAMTLGFSWLKLFPASDLGPSWVKAVLAPFPELQIVATGGMNSANARAFLSAGARAIAVGGAIGQPGEIEALAQLARSQARATPPRAATAAPS